MLNWIIIIINAFQRHSLSLPGPLLIVFYLWTYFRFGVVAVAILADNSVKKEKING